MKNTKTKKTFVWKVVGVFYESKNTLIKNQEESDRGEKDNAVIQKVILIVHKDGRMELKPADLMEQEV